MPPPIIETLAPATPEEPLGDTLALNPTDTPSPTNTPTVIPSPTVDANLPVWTILVYMAADNNLDPASVLNINQMEAAALSDQINVIVQVDRAANAEWSDTRRYRIRPDDDITQIGSELVAEMGEQNMGDPNTLSDFVKWGIDTYPAQNYGLVLWNHGVGWSGIASDDTNGDDLSLNDLRGGLARGMVDQAGLKFEMVGFDACLMGQLDVYDALVPYANFAVASEELTPVQGWAYTEWLNSLVTQAEIQASDPISSGSTGLGSSAAIAAVDTFMTHYTDSFPKPFVTMAAVDLSQIGQVQAAFSNLLSLISAEDGLYVGRVGQARAGAETYARAYGLNADRYASLDLHHFSNLMAESVTDPDIESASSRLQSSIESAVIHSGRGRGLKEANGIAVHFPASDRNFDTRYINESENEDWIRYL